MLPGSRCSFAVCKSGKCIQQPVEPLEKGGNDINEALGDIVTTAIGEERIDEYKTHNPIGWTNIKLRLEDLKKVDDRDSHLQLGRIHM